MADKFEALVLSQTDDKTEKRVMELGVDDLPEGDVLLFNPRHPGAAHVGALQTRPFSFAECLHAPPMRIIYEGLR